MKDMSEAELKVTLAVIRQTLGYHKKQDPISLTQLQKMTGLSRTACAGGAESSIKHGFIELIGTGKRGVKIYGLVVNLDQSTNTTSSNSGIVEASTSSNSGIVTSSKLLPTKEKVQKKKKKENNTGEPSSHIQSSLSYFTVIAQGAWSVTDLKGLSEDSRKRIGSLVKVAKTLSCARVPDISDEQGAALVAKFCAAETFKPGIQGKSTFELKYAAWLEKNAPYLKSYLASLAPKIIPDDKDIEWVDPAEVERVIRETVAAVGKRVSA